MDALGNRMKNYENCYRFYLPKRQAVIVRIDGKAFHNFTKGFARPYDELFAQCMWDTTTRLCENIGGCVFGYTQSDEISLVLVDYKNINTEPWFGNNLQKIVSVSASMATLFFGDAFRQMLGKAYRNMNISSEQLRVYQKAYATKMACFDSRAFIIPREEVLNYLYWRQTDCVRNSIQLAGQAYFSHNQLQNKSCDDIQEMLFQEHNINWANYPNWFKNGVAFYKKKHEVNHLEGDKITTVIRNHWAADFDTPTFIQKPNLINDLVIIKEN